MRGKKVEWRGKEGKGGRGEEEKRKGREREGRKKDRDMAHQLRVLTALTEVMSSNPSNYMVSHSHL